MTTVKQLKRLIEIEKRKEAKRNTERLKVSEKTKLKRQLFNLKHGHKVKTIKNVGQRFKVAGSNIANNFKEGSSNFSKQRKKKKGIGGFLQNIADNQ